LKIAITSLRQQVKDDGFNGHEIAKKLSHCWKALTFEEQLIAESESLIIELQHLFCSGTLKEPIQCRADCIQCERRYVIYSIAKSKVRFKLGTSPDKFSSLESQFFSFDIMRL
jgi:hypothetical protein